MHEIVDKKNNVEGDMPRGGNVPKGRGRPCKYHTIKERREMLRIRSASYYNKAENREKQNIKMELYRAKNRAVINERASRRRRMKTLEKRLTESWLSRGLLKIVSI